MAASAAPADCQHQSCPNELTEQSQGALPQGTPAVELWEEASEQTVGRTQPAHGTRKLVPKVDYVQRQRDYFRVQVSRAREARLDVIATASRLVLPDLKTALAAVARRDAAAAASSQSSRLPSSSSRCSSSFLAPPRTPPGSGSRASSSQGRRAAKQPRYPRSPPRTPPRGLPTAAFTGHRLSGSPGNPSTSVSSAPPAAASASASAEAGEQQQHLPPLTPPDVPQRPCALPSPCSTISLPPIACSSPAAGSADPTPLFGLDRLEARSRPVAAFSLPSVDGLTALVLAQKASNLGPKERRRSTLEFYEDRVEVDTSSLFVMDSSIRPDEENEEQLNTGLAQLKEGSAAAEQPEEMTYSHLVKPALKPVPSHFVFPSSEDWDPKLTLAWSNRGISVKKMGQLRDMLVQNSFLTGLQLAGNSLNNDCVSQIMSMLSLPEACSVRQLDLSSNASLDWHCAYAIATALGAQNLARPEPSASLRATVHEPSSPTKQLSVLNTGLRRLILAEVKLGDKGAVALAAALKSNRVLKDLNLSRCSILDHGGAALMDALTHGCLQTLDISWNSLGPASSRAMMDALASNGSLLYLNLSHNGLSDSDVAKALRGMAQNGTWLHVDLSYNGLGAGSAFVIAHLISLLGKRCAELILEGSYGTTWETSWQQLASSRPSSGRLTRRNSSGLAPDTSDPTGRIPHHRELGCQLSRGPVMLNVEGNPLGLAGLREILHSLNWIGSTMEAAAAQAQAQAQQQPAPGPAAPSARPATGAGALSAEWPVQIVLHNCNVDIGDAALDKADMEEEAMDCHSPNPFVPSLYKIAGPLSEEQLQAEAALQAAAKAPPAKTGAGKKAGKDSAPPPEPLPPPKYPLTCQSQRLDLHCPGGRYVLDMAHPASALLIRALLNLGAKLDAAAAKLPPGLGPARALRIHDVLVLGRASSAKRLEAIHDVDAGSICFTVEAPAQLGPAAHGPPLSAALVRWLQALLGAANERCNELWKLSIMRAACGQFYFSCSEALQLINHFNLATSQRLSIAEIMYARCSNPLDFWMQGMTSFHPKQVDMLMQRLGEFPAFNIKNPAGRYCLNLSRSVDRFVAMRLQEAAIQEAGSTARGKQAACYWVNWRNASLDGEALRLEGLTQLHAYTVPDRGLLRLDFVTYQVPAPGSEPCSEQALKQLLAELRGINRAHLAQLLEVRMAKRGAQPAVRAQPSYRASAISLKPGAPAAQSSWPVSKVLETPLRLMASLLRSEAAPLLLQYPAAKGPPPPLKHAPSLRVSGKLAVAAPQPVAWWQEVEGGGFKSAGKALLERHIASATASGRLKPAAEQAAAASRASTAEPSRRQAPGAKQEDEDGDSWLLPPPAQRAAGAHMTQQQAAQAEELTAQLLQVLRLQDAALLLCKYGAVHTARLLHTLLKASPSSGHKVAGLLLEHMAPTFAIRFLYALYDQPAALLPPETRQALASGCSPQLLEHLAEVQVQVNALAMKRAQQVRIALQCFASAHFVTLSQLYRVARALRHEPDRCTAVVACFSRIVDRGYVAELLQAMGAEEQRQVMQRLGHWHVWQSLKSCPLDWGDVHLYLDLSDAEQKEVAKEIVHMACKASMAVKAQDPAQQAQQLLNLRVDGELTTMEEDDTFWSNVEGSCSSLEFDVASSLDQMELKWPMSAVVVQRAWRRFRRRSKRLS